MATKTISLELDAYEKLRRAKKAGESFSAVVRRACFGPADTRGASILGALEGLAVKAADHDALAGWEAGGVPERTVSPSPWTKERGA
jgi:hypothetical protein